LLSSRCNPLATRAVYSFSGFLDPPERHFFFHHDGYPKGAAHRFAVALRHSSEDTSFLTAFLSTQRYVEPMASLNQVTDAAYRYRIQLVRSSQPSLLVQCWKLMPDHNRWHPRSSRMLMDMFIQRFLPGIRGR
jgi:hypothetical protein